MANQSVDRIAKDFDSFVESIISFATTEYGEQTSANRVWTNFNLSSFSRNWAEIVAYLGDQLMFYLDTQSNQAYLETATIPAFVFRIAEQNGFNIPTQKAASGEVTFTTSGPYEIPSGTSVLAGNVRFFTTRTIQGSSAEEVNVGVIQGRQVTETFTAEGVQNEEIILNEPLIIVNQDIANPELKSPIVRVSGNDYSLVQTPIQSSPLDRIYTRELLPDGRTRLVFGDGTFGRKLTPNQTIQVTYRIGGGSQGNLQPGEISTIGQAITNAVSVTNNEATSGGVDELSLNEIKQRTPLALKTVAGAINLDDYGDILEANFSQVLKAKSEINNTETGVDVDVFVLPQAQEVTNITDNPTLYDTLNDFLERTKVVGTRFLIKDGEEIRVILDLECYLNQDASRSSVESDIREQLQQLFDLQTGNLDNSGIQFAQNVRLGDIFNILQGINEIDRFEVKKFTVAPRLQAVVTSPNQEFYTSEVETFESVGINEWAIVTSETANPEPVDGQVSYKVFKRTRGNATSLTESSVTDINLDLTLVTGNAIVIGSTTVTDPTNVFSIGQYDGFILVDQNNNIWSINETRSQSLIVNSPALNDAAITTIPNGEYSIVRSFVGEQIAINGLNFSVLYNNKNTFFSPGASFNTIATPRTDFFLSEEQTNQGTYGVPLAITTVTPQGSNPGDLVNIEFNGNPPLQNIDDSFVLIDRTGQTFEIAEVSDDETPVVSYNNTTNLNNSITLDDSTNSYISIPFFAENGFTDSFISTTARLQKVSSPAGEILVEIREDDGSGKPGSIIATSDGVLTSAISTAGFNLITFSFSSTISLTKGTKYHYIVRGDNAYQISYGNGDGEIQVGTDENDLEYYPALTASGQYTLLDNSLISTRQKPSSDITVVDNNFRRRTQAKNDITIISNDFTGSNQITIAGVPFVEGTDFNAGGTITDTRNNLKAAIDSALSGTVLTENLSTDGILLTADETNYPGESGNDLTIEVSESSPENFDIRATNFGGGVDGDSITINAPEFINTGEVNYVYDSGTGEIQYQSAVSLPSFTADSNTQFIDGAGNKFDIISIDDVNDRLFIATGETVDSTISNEFSGVITRDFKFEMGANVDVGTDVDDTAENLRTEIATDITDFNVTRSTNVVTIEFDYFGDFGNQFTLKLNDEGTENFTLSSETLEGGVASDTLTIDGDVFTAVDSGATGNEFVVGGDSTTTLNNIQDAINNLGNVVATVDQNALVISAPSPGEAGNSITLELSQTNEAFSKSGDTLEGGQNNLRVQISSDGTTFVDRTPDTDLIFRIALSQDTVLIASKSDEQGNQVIPQTSINNQIDSAIGKRYYSDNGEISFLIATLSPNAFIVGANDADLFGRGTVEGNPDTRVDQFIFRTSKFKDDVNNLRSREIPVLRNEDVNINLLGGVS